MHQTIEEKNGRIEELLARCSTTSSRPHDDSKVQFLRDERRRLERRTFELERALKDALETDDEIGEHGVEADCTSAMVPGYYSNNTK